MDKIEPVVAVAVPADAPTTASGMMDEAWQWGVECALEFVPGHALYSAASE